MTGIVYYEVPALVVDGEASPLGGAEIYAAGGDYRICTVDSADPPTFYILKVQGDEAVHNALGQAAIGAIFYAVDFATAKSAAEQRRDILVANRMTDSPFSV